ncbi:hypothetical protein I203_107585 [Kwoniella mangroviensis CBS 8507]|uniref:hypothetical protein n=1 Tax=Kwoniella mangroviensis CBS 8507 TaxID=1296122 RepID=UPI00080D4ED0|nr:uncharacterized protein I203_02333 [Kwoniella mangroviensis CBS 8507]OCF68939.1 hypothetical protein I203_02333 [Kwoniella mangroviensis CBS 8507]
MSLDPVIPTIDLSSDSPEKQAQVIKDALGSVGFFAVLNGGPKVEDIDALFEYSKDFFALPMEEKEKFLAGPSGSGYTKLLSQALGEGKRDHKETFSYGKYCGIEEQPMPNPFSVPDTIALQTIRRFYKDCHEVSEKLMELFAQALELPEDHFRQSHSFGLNTAMSLIHYPSLDMEGKKQLGEKDIRAGAHRDWGTLTLLFQSTNPSLPAQPGLEVYLPKSAIYKATKSSLAAKTTLESKDHDSASTDSYYTIDSDGYEWHPAPVPPRGGFLVNVGLAMELWSSGIYKATLHRVGFPNSISSHSETEQDEKEEAGLVDRYSLAFFVQPDDNVELNPILPGGKIDYTKKAITSGELFNTKLKESMDRSKNIPIPDKSE